MANAIESKTLFTVHTHADEVLHEQHHGQYLVHEERIYSPDWATASPVLPEVVERDITPAPISAVLSLLRITTDHIPTNGRAFTFGSAQECDFLLARSSKRGISGVQFSIFVNCQFGGLLLKNHSRNGTRITSTSLDSTILWSQRAVIDGEEVHVHLGIYDICVRVPNHSLHWQLFSKNLLAYLDRVSAHVPLEGLQLKSAPSTSRGLSAGTIYTFTSEIGKGGYGVVHRAIDRSNGEVVAVKQYLNHQHARTQEAMLLQSLSHVNIVKCHAFMAREGDPPFLVKELINGNNLMQEHLSLPLQHFEVKAASKQLLDGLAYMHDRNITHRDVKPANVMVVTRCPVYVKLADFGLAALTDKLRSFSGTPWYAAPEILDGQPYNEKVDIWSLGVTSLRLFFGLPQNVHDRESYCEWPGKIQRYLVGKPQCITTHFLATVLRENPNERPPARECLEHELFILPDCALESTDVQAENRTDAGSTRPFTRDGLPTDPFTPVCDADSSLLRIPELPIPSWHPYSPFRIIDETGSSCDAQGSSDQFPEITSRLAAVSDEALKHELLQTNAGDAELPRDPILSAAEGLHADDSATSTQRNKRLRESSSMLTKSHRLYTRLRWTAGHGTMTPAMSAEASDELTPCGPAAPFVPPVKQALNSSKGASRHSSKMLQPTSEANFNLEFEPASHGDLVPTAQKVQRTI